MKKRAKWIWYPGEYEITLANKLLFRRDHRGVLEPPFWRIDAPYCNVFFYRSVDLAEPETIRIRSSSQVVAMINEVSHILPQGGKYTLPKGCYTLMISAYAPPGEIAAIYVEGETIVSDEEWKASLDKHRGDKVYVGFSDVLRRESSLCGLRFRERKVRAELVSRRRGAALYKFPKETFGYFYLSGIEGGGKVRVYYGESREEAEDTKFCETFDTFEIQDSITEYRHAHSRAMLYARVVFPRGMRFQEAGVYYEYLPLKNKGGFHCSDVSVNKIYTVAEYTFRLNSRETFLDGLKRDRWFWAGDAYQCYLFNYYSFFDREINRRTMWALRGKEPVTRHINHIVDYTFLWFISLYDHCLYMGDKMFVRSIFGRAKTLMQYCMERLGEDGFVTGRPYEDWVFLDWASMPMEGALSAEQILLLHALNSMREIALWLGDEEQAKQYADTAARLRDRIFEVFYDEEKGIFYHNAIKGTRTDSITRYANIFALMYGLVNEEQKKKIIRSVILNDAVQRVETPYAKLYELVSLCEAGKYCEVCDRIAAYWGGMLREGATTFWEMYDPDARGAQHYSMYNNAFTKSLCHAWGASPIYIFGRYFLGVYPTKFGCEEYCVCPHLGKYSYIRGAVPLADGAVEVYMDREKVTVFTNSCRKGVLRLEKSLGKVASFTRETESAYEIDLHPGERTEIFFSRGENL